MRIIDVVTKTPLVEKNSKFSQYLKSEHNIMMKLQNIQGVINCFGMKTINNQITKKTEEHLVL
jgi:hypothetical protein